jgi:hypothetical protein
MRDDRPMPSASSVVEKNLRAAVRPAAAAIGCRQRFVHDVPDGACAPPALGVAAEAAINLAAGSRRFVARQGRTDVLVGEHVAGTHDHRGKVPGELVTYPIILSRTRKLISIKKAFF